MSHTPAPWASSGLGIVQAETGELICAAVFEDGSPYPNAEANIDFISHTPEMAKLLREFAENAMKASRWELLLMVTKIENLLKELKVWP